MRRAFNAAQAREYPNVWLGVSIEDTGTSAEGVHDAEIALARRGRVVAANELVVQTLQ